MCRESQARASVSTVSSMSLWGKESLLDAHPEPLRTPDFVSTSIFPLLCFQTSCQKQKLSVEIILTASTEYVRAEGRKKEGFLSIVKSRYR